MKKTMKKRSDITSLTDAQRTLRYAICVDFEIFSEENEGATKEDFLKAFNADKDWNEGYDALLERAGETFSTVFNEVYEAHYRR